MNLNKQLELADAIFGRDPQTGLERVTATATSDSADGAVTVEFDDGTTAEVPVTGAVKLGDEVIVNVQNGTPVAAGSAGWGDRVQAVADEAQAVAEATNQHFWDDSNGAHVTEVEQDEWTDPTSPSYHTGRDITLNSNGILLRKDYVNLAAFTPSAVSFYDGSGDMTASFGTSGAVIGKIANGESRTEVVPEGMHVISRLGGTDYPIASIQFGQTVDEHGTHVDASYYTMGGRTGTIGQRSFVEGNNNEASSSNAHAEGNGNTASGFSSHAEGSGNTASNECAHAEGGACVASGQYSHAEGYYSEASGTRSHAQNLGTVAAGYNQTAMGMWNDEDTNNAYALIVGNGSDDSTRSNAFTVAWNGDIVASGEVTDGHGNVLSQAGGGATTTWYGTSSTAASTQTKDVTCAGFTLEKGALLLVYFSNENTYGTLKLNVNSTGAKSVYHRGAATSSSNFATWSKKSYVLFQYDGTNWVYITSSDSRIIAAKDRLTSANIGTNGTAGVNHLVCKTTTMTTGTPASDGHILDFDWDASYGNHAQLFLPCVDNVFPQWRREVNGVWGAWDTLYTVANPPTGAGFVSFKRFVPDSGASAQTLGTSVQALNSMGSSDGGNAPVSHVSTGTYSINAAGTWRVKVKLGMYPNSTAATRLCAGIYDTSVSGTRLSLGVQAVYNLTANSPSKVVTVECDYTGTFSAGDVVAIGAFADVTNAKVYKGGSDLTCVTFEKVG